MSLQDNITDLPFSSTLFFPVSANPIGFNHFAAVEAMLRLHPHLNQVVLIPSNGLHPDPKKPDPEVGAQDRLTLLQRAVETVADERQSLLARLASDAGEPLRLSSARIIIWPRELDFQRVVFSRELVEQIRAERPEDSAPLLWFAGSDLVARMSDPDIFSSEDLAFLIQNCTYLVLEREDQPLDIAVQTLFQTRQQTLRHHPARLVDLPAWLTPFLLLSSTRIREAAELGDPLAAMLPAPCAQMVVEQGWYQNDPSQVTPLGTRLMRLQQELHLQAAELTDWLVAQGDPPPRVAVAEASAGGWLTVALAGRAGASRVFAQSRFAYDKTAKASLLEGIAGEQNVPMDSAVTPEMAKGLAEGIREKAAVTFGLAETGMAGPPDGIRRSLKNGQCHIALATPEATHCASITLGPFLTRREHQMTFGLEALRLALKWLSGGA